MIVIKLYSKLLNIIYQISIIWGANLFLKSLESSRILAYLCHRYHKSAQV